MGFLGLILVILAAFLLLRPWDNELHINTTQGTIGPYINILLTVNPQPDDQLLESHIRLDPPLAFDLVAEGNEIWIRSELPQTYGESIRLTIDPFTDQANRMKLRKPFSASFTIRSPRIALFDPDENAIIIKENETMQQVLPVIGDILQLNASFDGRWLLWQAEDEANMTSTFLFDTERNKSRIIEQCDQVLCDHFSMSPTAAAFVFTSLEYHSANVQLQLYNILDHSETTLLTFSSPLQDPPIWSPDGKRIAVFDPETQTVLVFSLDDRSTRMFQKEEISLGAWSNDGSSIYLRHTHRNITNTYSHLCRLDLLTGEFLPLEYPALLDGQYSIPAMVPGEDSLVFARQNVAGENTRQLWMLNITSGNIEKITDQQLYSHARYSFDLTGDFLVYQRLDVSQSDVKPEIWLWNRGNGQRQLLHSPGVLPVWLP